MSAAKILAKKWNLEDVKPHFAGVRGQVFFATRHSMPVVLKIPTPETWTPESGRALLHFFGYGAVRVLADDELGVLMERVEPGKPLASLIFDGHDDRATQIICEVAADLHKAGPGESFPSIPPWRDEFDKYGEREGDFRLPAKQYARAKGLYQELALSQGRQTLLHGDLHHNNIISDHLRDWVAIDPKGWVGEREYEFGCLLRNPGADPRHFAKPEIVKRRVDIIEKHTNLDCKRILLWAYSQAVLSAIWDLEDGVDPMRGLATANAIEPLL